MRQLADRLFRYESGKMVSILTGILGTAHLQLAEDVVQESLIRSLTVWPYYGIPDNPPAWLLRTAKNLALDHVRREKNFRRKQPEIVADFEARLSPADAGSPEPGTVTDDTLRLMFVCCHPSLPPDVQSALALKTLCGLTPAEIARSFLASEAAIAKRLTRARQRLRDQGIPFEIPPPAELPNRLDGVLKILYLLFSEGHKSSLGDAAIRADLCDEALRLGTLLASHPAGDTPATHALLALMNLTAARLPARTDAEGNLLRLEDQDRSKWERARLEAGVRHLARSATGNALTPYHLQAAIAACHSLARDDASTDWPRILALYDRLLEIQPSPVVALNRAVALAKVEGADAGLAAVREMPDRRQLDDYHLLHAVLGELELQRGDPNAAADHFLRARDLAATAPERGIIERRLRDCAG